LPENFQFSIFSLFCTAITYCDDGDERFSVRPVMSGDDDPEARTKKFRQRSPYLVPKEVAAYLRVSESGLSRMRERKTGPKYHKEGRSVRYHIDDIEAWIKNNSPRG
jgi:predicted DNA-binding transcriptional regulator AlpA